MDADFKVRKQVTFGQLKTLLEFMKDHQELARGLTRGRRGKLHTINLWNSCAKRLNACKDGAEKDAKAWSKYWCDWKYRVRRRALELKAAKDAHRTPPDGVTPLSVMEENLLGIIGDAAVDNIVIKSDPLGDDGSEDDMENTGEISSMNQSYDPYPENVRKRTRQIHSSRELSDLDDHDRPTSSAENHTQAENEKQKVTTDDEAVEFLRLEKEKIENARKLHETVLTLTSEITRLTDVMSDIRDVIVNNRINL